MIEEEADVEGGFEALEVEDVGEVVGEKVDGVVVTSGPVAGAWR